MPADDTGDARLKVHFSSYSPFAIGNYDVLTTDYQNYSVVYSCVDLGVAKIESGWLLTREALPELDLMDKYIVDAQEAFGKLGYDFDSKFAFTTQGEDAGCDYS